MLIKPVNSGQHAYYWMHNLNVMKMRKFNVYYYYSGISRDKTWADKLMYIPNVDTQDYPFFILQLVVETFELIN